MTARRPPARTASLARAAMHFAFYALLLGSAAAEAAELRWGGRPFHVVANEKRLVDFLRELAASQGTTAVIDPKVDGTISGRFEINGRGESARTILDSVCSGYGLTWYYDGTLLFIEPASEARSEVLSMGSAGAGQVQDAINRLQLADRRYPLQVNASAGTVFVAGPKRYVDAVRQVLRSVDARAAATDRAQVRLFPLKYAWAGDFEVRRSGRTAVVPGVVSVLRELFDPSRGRLRGGVSIGASPGSAVAMPRATGERKYRLPSGASGNAQDFGPTNAAEAEPGMPSSSSLELPQIQADPRINAVLIRDLPERMGEYEKLIASMDIKPRLVEIEVTIMDIGTDSLERLGIDWRAHGRRFDLQTGNGDSPALSWSTTGSTAGQTGSAAPVGGVFTASIGHELRNFLLARVSALQNDGEANFVARPKVLTLDNTEASLENKSEFYVKVPGFQDASLYTVVAGTDVRVTPLVVDEGGARGVMLNINIGDDSLSSDTVENLPIVRRRSVVTQAMVEEGKSILLAGYSSEERSNVNAGVPGLSAIPVIGRLFKHNEKKLINAERFYMLTPRFVLPEATAAAAPAVPAPQPGELGGGS